MSDNTYIGQIEAQIVLLKRENERLLAYANHERSLGAERPMIELESARQEIERLRTALKAVEDWWLFEGIKHFTGAPYAMFAVRRALTNEQIAREDHND